MTPEQVTAIRLVRKIGTVVAVLGAALVVWHASRGDYGLAALVIAGNVPLVARLLWRSE